MMADLMRALKQLCLIALGGFLILFLILTVMSPTKCFPFPKSGQLRINATAYKLASIDVALMTFEVEIGRYPTTNEGLQALVHPPTIKPWDWHDPYMDTIPKDAWGREFRYVFPSTVPGCDYELTSAGPDGHFGTRDDLAPIAAPQRVRGPMPWRWEWQKDPRGAAYKYAFIVFEALGIALVAKALFKKKKTRGGEGERLNEGSADDELSRAH